jgi:hypothetical protein
MKNKYFKPASILLVFSCFFTSCAKDEGKGGDASIYGKVFVKNYNSTFTQLVSSYYAADTYVYLIYGDDISYGERVKTDYEGEFEFKYLYPGDYRVYVYSDDSLMQSPTGTVAVVKDLHISGRKSKVNAGKIVIFE